METKSGAQITAPKIIEDLGGFSPQKGANLFNIPLYWLE